MAPEHCIVRTIDPRNPTGPKIPAVFPNNILRYAHQRNTVRFWNVRAAVAVLENPKRIFSGLRELNPGWWCYVGRPETWCLEEGPHGPIFKPFPERLVFTVLLNDRMWVYDWLAELSDSEDSLSPAGWRDRYQALTWKSDP